MSKTSKCCPFDEVRTKEDEGESETRVTGSWETRKWASTFRVEGGFRVRARRGETGEKDNRSTTMTVPAHAASRLIEGTRWRPNPAVD